MSDIVECKDGKGAGGHCYKCAAEQTKRVVFYCGHTSRLVFGRQRGTADEVRFESLTETFEWLKDRIAAGDSYYIDVREE